jgi:DNA-binding MarR family transcriptional regulator
VTPNSINSPNAADALRTPRHKVPRTRKYFSAKVPDVASHEAPQAPLTAEEQDFLRALARAMVLLPRTFVADLGREHGLSMSEYFTMMYVSEAPQQRLRMGDLAEATALSLPAVTRVVTLLEGKGLLVRTQSTADRRGRDVALTDVGRERLAQAQPAQVASVRRRIFNHLDGVDLRMATAVLSRLGEDDATHHPERTDS